MNINRNWNRQCQQVTAHVLQRQRHQVRPAVQKAQKKRFVFLLPLLLNIFNAFLALQSQIIYSLSLNVIQVLVPARCLKTNM